MTTQTAAVPNRFAAKQTARPGTRKQTIKNALPAGLVSRGVFSAAVQAYVPWGEDNRQPQRTLEAVAGSGTAAVCVALKAKFIKGNGFTDLQFAATKVNRLGLTADGLLGRVAPDLAALEGFALLLNFNALGNVCEVFYVPLAQWRAAQPDADGITRFGYVLNNLSTEAKKYTNGLVATNAKRYPLFDANETPDARLARILSETAETGGFTTYTGELFIYCHQRPGAITYPRPVYDAVLRDLLTEASLKVSRHRDVRDGFATQAMITEFGTADPTDEKLADDAEKYGDFVGEEGARFIVQYAVNKDSKPQLDMFTVNNSSDRYKTEEESLRKNIRATFQIPTILYGEEVAGKLGTADEFDDAVKYVQTLVVNEDQRAIEEAFSTIFSLFQVPGTAAAGINAAGDYTVQNLSLSPPAEVPTTSQKTLKNLSSVPALVANQILGDMTINERRRLVDLPDVANGDVVTGAQPVTINPPVNNA